MLTYVYCVIASTRRPRLGRAIALPSGSRPRLIEIGRGLYLLVADVPEREYDEGAIKAHLADLKWVSRAAVAHERAIELVATVDAVLPMKLFTIFTSVERAVADVTANRARITAAIDRVRRHEEFGIRVVLRRAIASASARGSRAAHAGTGAAYLTRKKTLRDAATERAERARETVGAVYERLAARARDAKRRSPAELPLADGPLLLDAAFLVPRSRSRSFRALAAREARALEQSGYGLTLTGPWPPYTFVQD